MKLIVFDLETTGLTLHPLAPLDQQPRAIEFACVTIDSRARATVDEYSTLINPRQPLDEEVVKITGLTDEALRGQPSIVDVWPEIVKRFAKADVGVAHNYQFDDSVLRYEMERHSLSPFNTLLSGICTVQTYTEEFGHPPKLVELYEKVMGSPLNQTHRALDDARALASIIIKEQLWTLLSPN